MNSTTGLAHWEGSISYESWRRSRNCTWEVGHWWLPASNCPSVRIVRITERDLTIRACEIIRNYNVYWKDNGEASHWPLLIEPFGVEKKSISALRQLSSAPLCLCRLPRNACSAAANGNQSDSVRVMRQISHSPSSGQKAVRILMGRGHPQTDQNLRPPKIAATCPSCSDMVSWRHLILVSQVTEITS